MHYLDLKHLHMALAALSVTLFIVRGCRRMTGAALAQQRWAQRAPHLVDTLLLASGISLAYWSGQAPFSHPWLGAKLVALLAYIALGSVALRYGRTPGVRAAAFAAALACVATIVLTARTKNPLLQF